MEAGLAMGSAGTGLAKAGTGKLFEVGGQVGGAVGLPGAGTIFSTQDEETKKKEEAAKMHRFSSKMAIIYDSLSKIGMSE